MDLVIGDVQLPRQPLLGRGDLPGFIVGELEQPVGVEVGGRALRAADDTADAEHDRESVRHGRLSVIPPGEAYTGVERFSAKGGRASRRGDFDGGSRGDGPRAIEGQYGDVRQ